MKKDTKKIVGVVLVVAILLVAIGYAAIGTKTLTINGSATASTNDSNFVVKFTGTPTTGGAGTTTATINGQDQLKATMNVTGLTAKGDVATATYTISNESPDLSAALAATTTCSNTEYFNVTYNIAKTPVAKGATTTITVTVELIKTPIEKDITATVGVTITATPQQPTA